MKQMYWILTGMLMLALVGCGGEKKKVYKMDTSALEKAFADASGTLKEEVTAAAEAFQAKDIVAGADHLTNAARTPGLTEDQINALYDAVRMVQNWMTNTPEDWNNKDYQLALQKVTDQLNKVAGY